MTAFKVRWPPRYGKWSTFSRVAPVRWLEGAPEALSLSRVWYSLVLLSDGKHPVLRVQWVQQRAQHTSLRGSSIGGGETKTEFLIWWNIRTCFWSVKASFQSPNLSRIKILWPKSSFCFRKPTNLDAVYQLYQDEEQSNMQWVEIAMFYALFNI